MRARLLTPTILGAIVIGAIAAIGIVGTIGIVGMIGSTSKVGADEAVPLAAPKPLNQIGFPGELYVADSGRQSADAAKGRAWARSCSSTNGCRGTIRKSAPVATIPHKGFTDQLPTSKGIHDQFGQRNAPTVLNAMFNVLQFWDGRGPTLERPGQGSDPQSDRDGDEELRRGRREGQRDPRIPEGVQGGVRRTPNTLDITARDRRLRTDPGRLQYALRSLHGRRPEGDQRIRPSADGRSSTARGAACRVTESTRPSRCSATIASTTSASRPTRRTSCRWRARRWR